MELEYYSKYFMYGGIAVSVIATLFFYFLSRMESKKKADIGIFLTCHLWPGDIVESKIISCKITDDRFGNDFFYDIRFHLPGDNKLYTAKTLVNISQMSLIRPGLRMKVKKGNEGRLAVIKIEF
ncbi:hypothetical protein E0L21_11975 [Kosakonia quasisacchari]|uniref:Uncharacterized protein n=1 Tax=Kosakonia quasisacchari TaxID=2529380 RepID=A0A4V2LZ72_9ENTR|nr:hypothetical protein [Kosakonia quasisacchari]TCC07126.1 hypothetical protein E0L21_11975 [Kosakonia quasisacchari]